MVLEERHRQRDQVIEIDRLVGLQGGRIAGEGIRGEQFGVVLRVLAGLVGRDQRALPVRDQRLQLADDRLVDAAGQLGDDGKAVGGIEDREVRLVAERARSSRRMRTPSA
jgi:hypothetical protein